MRVRFLLASASPAGTFRAGQVAEIEDAEQASQLVHSGVAEELGPVGDERTTGPRGSDGYGILLPEDVLNAGRSEIATIEPSEAGVRPGPKPRQRPTKRG